MEIKPPPSTGYNLTQVAGWSRGFIKYGAISLVVFMVGRVVLNATIALIIAMTPPKPVPPTFGFGSLPDLILPPSVAQVDTYTLETRSGGLPGAPRMMPVFFMPKSSISIFSLDNAKKLAAGLGFVFEPEQISTINYRWKRTTPLPSVLDVDIINQHFTVKTDWSSDPTFLANINPPTDKAASDLAKNTLTSAGVLTTDIATSEGKISYLKARGSGYEKALSFSEAEFLQFDLRRTPINQKYPVLRSDPTKGNARLIMSGTKNASGLIVDAELIHFPVDYDRPETYPLINSNEAWQRLSNGNGYIASFKPGVQKAVVREMYLAYYDSDEPQQYLQPIFVFTGDDDFVAYVPAVDRTKDASNYVLK